MNGHRPGTLIGGTLLIAGSCLGAGMLALPLLTGLAGFFPSLVMFLAAWTFMTLTALLMVEANGWFQGQVNLLSMVGRSLGGLGRFFCWGLYLFLFYSLLVAYISATGSFASSYFQTYISVSLPQWIGSLFFVLLFATVVYRGTRLVDHWNRFLVFGKIGAFICMVAVGISAIKPQLLLYTKPEFAIFSFPVLIIAFGYHNMIPTLMGYMQGDVQKVRTIILTGSLIALGIYLIWEFVVLGIVPPEGKWGLIESWKLGRQASDAVAGVTGVSWVSSFAGALSFFSLLSSFLAQTLALVHFLADGVGIKHIKQERISICVLALLPPLILSILFPEIFIKALNFAGGICAVILFGVIPVCMVWKGRYIEKMSSSYTLLGGKPLLAAVFVTAIFILFFQISTMLDASYIPKP